MAGFGAVGAIGGAIAQPIAAHFAQKRQHKYIKKYMKNKYQWMVDDLRAAGLNPILAYNNQPSMGQPGIPSIAGGQGATAISAMKLKSELRMLDASAKKMEAEAAQAQSRAALNIGQAKKVRLEVSEFKPSVGGVARRVLMSDEAKRAGELVLQAPQWIKDRLKAVAERFK